MKNIYFSNSLDIDDIYLTFLFQIEIDWWFSKPFNLQQCTFEDRNYDIFK